MFRFVLAIRSKDYETLCHRTLEVADQGNHINPYRVGWENFLRHVIDDAPLASDLTAGIRDVQLAEACYRSVDEGKWISLELKSD